MGGRQSAATADDTGHIAIELDEQPARFFGEIRRVLGEGVAHDSPDHTEVGRSVAIWRLAELGNT